MIEHYKTSDCGVNLDDRDSGNALLGDEKNLVKRNLANRLDYHFCIGGSCGLRLFLTRKRVLKRPFFQPESEIFKHHTNTMVRGKD